MQKQHTRESVRPRTRERERELASRDFDRGVERYAETDEMVSSLVALCAWFRCGVWWGQGLGY